jgi:hypothetical protein
MRSRTLRNERQRDLERGRLSTYRVSRVQGVWASARPAASDASSVRSMRLVLLGGSPRRWANTLAPSAESRRAFGTGPDDCVSSAAVVSSSAHDLLVSGRKQPRFDACDAGSRNAQSHGYERCAGARVGVLVSGERRSAHRAIVRAVAGPATSHSGAERVKDHPSGALIAPYTTSPAGAPRSPCC